MVVFPDEARYFIQIVHFDVFFLLLVEVIIVVLLVLLKTSYKLLTRYPHCLLFKHFLMILECQCQRLFDGIVF